MSVIIRNLFGNIRTARPRQRRIVMATAKSHSRLRLTSAIPFWGCAAASSLLLSFVVVLKPRPEALVAPVQLRRLPYIGVCSQSIANSVDDQR
jgi:hypothetical protein